MLRTGRTRNNRLAAKRTVMSVLHEDEEMNDTNIMDLQDSIRDNDLNASKGFVLPDEISIDSENPGSSEESIRLLIDDIENEVKKRQDAIILKAEEAVTEQKQVAFTKSITLPKAVKKMTIREYNKMNGCDILEIFKKFDLENDDGGSSSSGKKRVRPVGTTANGNNMCMKTPARGIRTGRNINTPGTVVRTVKKGELAFSKNGSPVDISEQGDLVATVSKKRRGNNNSKTDMAAAFDINIGEGRYINLSNPGSTEDLTEEMKEAARLQLKVMQDQMERLMAQLGK